MAKLPPALVAFALLLHSSFLVLNGEYILFPSRSPGYSGWAPFGDGGARMEWLGLRLPTITCFFVALLVPGLVLEARSRRRWVAWVGLAVATSATGALASVIALPLVFPYPMPIAMHEKVHLYETVVTLALAPLVPLVAVFNSCNGLLALRPDYPGRACALAAALATGFLPYTFFLDFYLFFD